MAAQQHRIRRQVLEVHAPEEDIAGQIQRELGRIQRQYLEPILDECCSEVSSPDRLHRIDKLEVDLGRVTLQSLDTELPRSLKSAMRKALHEQIAPLDRQARIGDGHPATHSHLELVAFFALNGTLPWWADSRRPRHLHESIDFLLEQAPDDLASFLVDLARHRRRLQRVVQHCGDDLLRRLFELRSASSPASRAARQQLDAILRSQPFQVALRSARVRSAFWVGVLAQSVTAAPHAGAAARDASLSPFWFGVFTSLAMESPDISDPLFAAVGKTARSGESRPNQALLPPLAALVEVGKHGARFSEALLSELNDVLRVTGCSDSGFAEELVQEAQSRALYEGKDQPYADGEAEGYQVNFRESRRREGRELQPDGNGRGEPVRPAELPDRRGESRPEVLDLAFGDADSVYIENSGLVILWPFLERFFDRLQLLNDRTFLNAAARHRAAGLLQYLVTKDPSPPEYQMILNKLLCGMAPDDILEFGEEVTEGESEECVNLLSAAIENAPVLRNMSHEGFRGSFLLRKGVLGGGEARWNLRVERETFDVVLDRFPWSFSWIKLPWMEIPLAVEW